MNENPYGALLALIAPLVGGKADPCVAKCDDPTLYAIAKQHDVTNLLYLARKDDPALDPAVRAKLERRLYASVQQQVWQESEAQAVFAALREKGIRFLPMKGILLRPLYPAPEMRTSSDVDVFYDREKREEVARVMRDLGYTEGAPDPNHDVFEKGGTVEFEMHRFLCMHIPTIDRYYEDVFARALPFDGSEYRQSDEDFYIYQTVHAMKHFTSGGTGLRTVLDYFIYLKNKPALDRAYLEKELSSIGLWRFHRTMEDLAQAWFGGAPMTEDLARVSAYILKSGVYGTTDNRVVNASGGRKSGFSYVLRRAFPPYGYMKQVYPVLQKCAILLPFCWLHRQVRALFRKHDHIAAELRSAGAVSEDAVRAMNAVMDTVGLREYR